MIFASQNEYACGAMIIPNRPRHMSGTPYPHPISTYACAPHHTHRIQYYRKPLYMQPRSEMEATMPELQRRTGVAMAGLAWNAALSLS
jgi:hypothetical protein